MVFSGLPFLFFFLPAFLLCYLPAGRRLRNAVLLVFSLFFYAWGEPLYLFLMLFTTLIDYTAGRLMERFPVKDKEGGKAKAMQRKRRLCLIGAVTVNLSLLAFFKYADFAVRIANTMRLMLLKDMPPFPLPGIALPIGISFYTFQSMSYTIDRYRGRVGVQKNYADYLTYVSMFPQLIAGPIVRYQTVEQELKERHAGRQDFLFGFRRFLIGLFRKVLIANQIGALWDAIRTAQALSVPSAWLGLLCFTLQLYYDFSAYSDMAIGLGRMMGFHFLENFNYPLSAVSITDFWRRWHISLSSWFKDYVYIPLGGNRRGLKRQLINLLIVFFLTGLWHGAFLNYILWGLYHGLFLVIEKFFLLRRLERWPRWIRHLYTIVIVVIGFGIFYFEDFSALGVYGAKLFGAAASGASATDILWYAGNYLPQLVIACVCAFPVYPYIEEKIAQAKHLRMPADVVRGVLALLLFAISIASLVRDTYNPFLYFRF